MSCSQTSDFPREKVLHRFADNFSFPGHNPIKSLDRDGCCGQLPGLICGNFLSRLGVIGTHQEFDLGMS